jgi:transposase, IS5 family
MERVVPWSALCGLIEPFYPKPGNGRPPVGVERMLRLYCLQQWFNLSDPAVEEALYDSLAMRQFVGIDLGREPVPDETTVCRFRHLLEEHDLGRQLFDEVHRHLADKGLRVATGTIVDATIISAPSSTKNATKARDPEMHQTKKGNQWYFGMKAHRGLDSRTKLIHAAVATPANVADSTVLPDLLHGNETRVWGDQAAGDDPAGMHQRPKISPIAAIATAVWWMRSSGGKTAPSPRYAPGSSIRSGSSSGCLALPSALSRAQQEYPSPAGDLRPCQSVCGAPVSIALPTDVICLPPHRMRAWGNLDGHGRRGRTVRCKWRGADRPGLERDCIICRQRCSAQQ